MGMATAANSLGCRPTIVINGMRLAIAANANIVVNSGSTASAPAGTSSVMTDPAAV